MWFCIYNVWLQLSSSTLISQTPVVSFFSTVYSGYIKPPPIVWNKSTSWTYLIINLILLNWFGDKSDSNTTCKVQWLVNYKTPVAQMTSSPSTLATPSLRHGFKGQTEKPSMLQWMAEGEEGQKKTRKNPNREYEYSFDQPRLTSSNWTKGKPVRWFCNLDENRSRHIAWSFLSRQDLKQKERQ